MLKKFGFVRVGAISSKISVCDVDANVAEIISCLKKAQEKGVEIATFGELSLTGYSCLDMFYNSTLLNGVHKGLERLVCESENLNLVFIVGAPLMVDGALYNCAVAIANGEILGVTAKTYIPQNSDEARYFSSANNLKVEKFQLCGQIVPISNKLIYKCKNHNFVSFAIEIGDDLWATNSPSNITSQLGANVIFNLSASNEVVSKKEYRLNLVKMQASKTLSCYVYASNGISESSSDLCFSGHSIIAEPSGKPIQNNRFDFESNMIYSDVDLFRVNNDRIKNAYKQTLCEASGDCVYFNLTEKNNDLTKVYSKTPFVSSNDEHLEEILQIQTYALARRIKHLGKSKMVIGISGGTDSTLAFLICLRVCKVLSMPTSDIIAVTMPGFGTSGRTYTNSVNLIKASGATFKEISIREACLVHYKDIGHDLNNYNITYENAQARERTQILFDLANDLGGIVVGTGDLSELVLGWATYNGDHMSNYGVNADIPKTLVRSLIEKIRDDSSCMVKQTLTDILSTPISPELLPLDKNGNIAQNSENSVGSYTLQDFFIYHFLRYGASVKKLYYLATKTFDGDYTKQQIKWTLGVFVRRFFASQFKRNCLPDGVKVGTVGVSPRGDLRMNSDVNRNLYLKELDELDD